MCLAEDIDDMLGFVFGLGGSEMGRPTARGTGGVDGSWCRNRMIAWSCAKRARNRGSSRLSSKNSRRS